MEAVEFVQKKHIPTICLGGGGYTKENVARCWAIESAMSVNHYFDPKEKLPDNLHYENSYSDNRLFYYPRQNLSILHDLNDHDY